MSGYTMPQTFGDLLDLLANDPSPLAVDHAEQIRDAILTVGRTTPGGLIDHGDVRALLRRRHGHLPAPERIGPTYRALRREGLIRFDQWTTSTDHEGGNAGKPERRDRLTGDRP